MSKDWEIDGYLLGDPTLDREQFEQRMLDDPDLALRVAAAAESLELMAVASRSMPAVSASKAVTRFDASKSYSFIPWKTVLAVAATSIIAVFSLQLLTQRGSLDEVATSWLAFEQDSPITSLENNLQDGILESDVDTALATKGNEDWLLDSAIAFYSDVDR